MRLCAGGLGVFRVLVVMLLLLLVVVEVVGAPMKRGLGVESMDPWAGDLLLQLSFCGRECNNGVYCGRRLLQEVFLLALILRDGLRFGMADVVVTVAVVVSRCQQPFFLLKLCASAGAVRSGDSFAESCKAARHCQRISRLEKASWRRRLGEAPNFGARTIRMCHLFHLASAMVGAT